MADLQIESRPRQFVGQPVSIPQESPVSEQVQRSSEQIQESMHRAAELLMALKKQQQAQATADALAKYRRMESAINEQAASIKNFDQRRQHYEEASTELEDQILREFPDMTVEGRDRLDALATSQRKTFHFKSITQQGAQQKKNLEDYVKSQSYESGKADTPQKRQQIDEETITRIHTDAANNLISKDHADYLTNKYIHDSNLQKVYALINKDPAQALKLPWDKSGVTSSEYLTAMTAARHVILQRNSGGEMTWKQIQQDATNRAVNGQMTAAEATQAYQQGKITKGVAELATGGAPLQGAPRATDPKVLNQLKPLIDGAQDEHGLDLVKQYMPYIVDNPADREALNARIEDKRRELKTTLGAHKANLDANIKQLFTNLTKRPGGRFISTMPNFQRAVGIYNSGMEEMKDAKNVKEQNEIANRVTQQINKELSVFSATPSKPPASTAPAKSNASSTSTPTSTPTPDPLAEMKKNAIMGSGNPDVTLGTVTPTPTATSTSTPAPAAISTPTAPTTSEYDKP